MCCKNFGIGLIVLSITLFLGITISEFFKLKDIPEIEVVEESEILLIENLKNCVPKDKNLKYQILPYDDEKRNYQEIDGDSKIIVIPVPTNPKANKSNSEVSTKDAPDDPLNYLEKNNSEQPVPLTEENLVEYKILLHKEICREKENGRK
ncbi:hypothetical protein BH20ACI4_BH20ACI4_33080 [soil metagenome]